jgi:hypothetical protein
MRRDATKVILHCLESTQWDPLTLLGRAREVERYLERAGYVIVPAEIATLALSAVQARPTVDRGKRA